MTEPKGLPADFDDNGALATSEVALEAAMVTLRVLSAIWHGTHKPDPISFCPDGSVDIFVKTPKGTVLINFDQEGKGTIAVKGPKK